MTKDKKVGIIFSECDSPSSPKFGNFHMKNKNHAPSLIKKISRMILQFYGLVNFQPTEEEFFSVFYVSGSSGKISTAWKVSKYGVTSGPYFPIIGLNTEIYGVNLRNQSEYRPEITPYLDTFHALQKRIENHVKFCDGKFTEILHLRGLTGF